MGTWEWGQWSAETWKNDVDAYKEGRDKERDQGSPEWLRGRKERRMKDGHPLKAVVDRLLH